MSGPIKLLRLLLAIHVAAMLAGCASTIAISSLSRPSNPLDAIKVSAFTYGKGQLGLDAGVYRIEYESLDGYYYRGPGLAVQVPPAINSNKVNYPDSKFPGGLFVSRSKNADGYRLYYYQLNIPGASGSPEDWEIQMLTQEVTASPTPLTAGIGAGLGVGLVNHLIDSGRGQIVLIPATGELDIASYTSSP